MHCSYPFSPLLLSSSHSFLSQQPPPFGTDMAATRSRPSWGFWGGAQTRIIYKSCSAIETVVFLLSNAWNGNTCYREHKITLSDTFALCFFLQIVYICACVLVCLFQGTLKLDTFLNSVNLARLDGKQVSTRSSWESIFYPPFCGKTICFLTSVNGQDIWAPRLLVEMGSEQWL